MLPMRYSSVTIVSPIEYFYSLSQALTYASDRAKKTITMMRKRMSSMMYVCIECSWGRDVALQRLYDRRSRSTRQPHRDSDIAEEVGSVVGDSDTAEEIELKVVGNNVGQSCIGCMKRERAGLQVP
jgi:hypothetical protein